MPSPRWAAPLEQALGYSPADVPTLPGRTLVLVDRSDSMWPAPQAHSPASTIAEPGGS
ncbi:hypothetical protein [[Kitasatospora] papulosa]|uniref:hypothetical protein n=1 Tax=[Kitasatospora] papulosa TaxID=1464011 RepID=UPI003810B4C5